MWEKIGGKLVVEVGWDRWKEERLKNRDMAVNRFNGFAGKEMQTKFLK